jgi:hypothetical protein
MIDRRNFLNTLAASALLATVPDAGQAGPKTPLSPHSSSRISLNGEWERHIAGKFYDKIVVPSSLPPSGFYTLNRRFVLPRLRKEDRIFVHFAGITYWGRIAINGQTLGEMNPYIPQEFEFTKFASESENEINVSMADLVPLPDGTARAPIGLGIHTGFEAYGGIIRDVWIEVRPQSFVENVRLAYELKNNLSSCTLRPRVMLSSTENTPADLQIAVHYNKAEVVHDTLKIQLNTGKTEIDVVLEMEGVSLWSPETSQLYELTAQLTTKSSNHSWACRTGFRQIQAVGREFRLNGERLVLNGVCRHDMWRDQGFSLSRQQQEQDMRMIKALGCNFVRLVHYPHDRHIIELADELGLLVSEEPGFWQTNFQTANHDEIELGYTILEKTIQRDWNSPSVMIWFLSNECTLTEEFLKEGKRRCNELDPIQRLVSAANDKDSARVKPLFVAAGMDFFDQHEYTFALDEMNQEAEFDGPSKPLTFSEWGGKSVGQAEPIMGQSVDRLIELVESGKLSGHMFWSWQDIRQYSRVDGELRDGILESGVVTESRDPRENVWAELSRLFERRRPGVPEKYTDGNRLNLFPLRRNPFSSKSEFHTVDLQPLVDAPPGKLSWKAFEAVMEAYWNGSTWNDQWKRSGSKFELWQKPELKVSGVSFRFPVVEDRVRPIVLTPEFPEIQILIHRKCTKLHILGQVSFPRGYPLLGQHGEQVAFYTLRYANGTTQSLPLRNGIEIAQSNCIDAASRITPAASAAQPVVEYVKDAAREHYQVLLLSVPTDSDELVSLQCKLHPSQPALAIFAITVEQ